MKNISARGTMLLAALLFLSVAVMHAQEVKKEIKKTAIPNTSASSGEEMFNTYCAVCHGKDGKGDGPAASEFKIPPANLTVLSANNNGKFPSAYVAQVIQTGPREAKAHGSKDMPVWGRLFHSLNGDDVVKLRIHNLSVYIESLQGK